MSDDAIRASTPGGLRKSRTSDELDRLAATEYETLRKLTHRLKRHFAGLAGPGTLSLIHEAYMSLRNSGESWHDRAHFLAVASLKLRHLIVDHARASQARKRGGEQVRISLDAEAIPAKKAVMDILLLDEALNRLARREMRQHRVAELRLFGGLSVEEIAAVLHVSERTVKDDWHLARAWLARELRSDSREHT